jgi:hypothetical protein
MMEDFVSEIERRLDLNLSNPVPHIHPIQNIDVISVFGFYVYEHDLFSKWRLFAQRSCRSMVVSDDEIVLWGCYCFSQELNV